MAKTQYIIGVIIILLVSSYVFFKFYLSNNDVTEEIGIPNFTSTLIDGSEFNSSSLKGKYVLIDFWGSWCGPCYKDMPILIELYNNTTSDNFEIVSIALEKDIRNGLIVSEKMNFPWRYQIVKENKFVLLSPLAQKFGVTQLPTKFLITPEGKINSIEDLKSLNNLIK